MSWFRPSPRVINLVGSMLDDEFVAAQPRSTLLSVPGGCGGEVAHRNVAHRNDAREVVPSQHAVVPRRWGDNMVCDGESLVLDDPEISRASCFLPEHRPSSPTLPSYIG